MGEGPKKKKKKAEKREKKSEHKDQRISTKFKQKWNGVSRIILHTFGIWNSSSLKLYRQTVLELNRRQNNKNRTTDWLHQPEQKEKQPGNRKNLRDGRYCRAVSRYHKLDKRSILLSSHLQRPPTTADGAVKRIVTVTLFLYLKILLRHTHASTEGERKEKNLLGRWRLNKKKDKK